MTKSASNDQAVDVVRLPLDLIDLPSRRRRIDPEWAGVLSVSIRERGQLQPIVVRPPKDGRYLLVFGGHRLEGARLASQPDIRAIIRTHDEIAADADARLAEIAENMIRRQNTALERAVDISDWRDLHEAVHGPFRRGRRKADETALDEMSAKFALNFTEAAQKALGVSRRAIFLNLKIATIPAEIRDMIDGLPIADSQTDLLSFAEEPAPRQKQLASQLADPETPTLAASIAAVDGVKAPSKPEPWAKVSDRFASLKRGEQFRFFEAHEALIEQWLAER